jgi:hypothetical protein
VGDFYKLVGSEKNPHTDWTAEVVLAKDDDGNVTKSISASVPVELSAADAKKVEALGFGVEKVSKEEADAAAGNPVGADAARSGPVFGNDNDDEK